MVHDKPYMHLDVSLPMQRHSSHVRTGSIEIAFPAEQLIPGS